MRCRASPAPWSWRRSSRSTNSASPRPSTHWAAIRRKLLGTGAHPGALRSLGEQPRRAAPHGGRGPGGRHPVPGDGARRGSEEADICLNLSEALSLSGRHAEALKVIDGPGCRHGGRRAPGKPAGEHACPAGRPRTGRAGVRDGHPHGSRNARVQGELRRCVHRAGHGAPGRGAPGAGRARSPLGIGLQSPRPGGRAQGRAGARGARLLGGPGPRPGKPRSRGQSRPGAQGAGQARGGAGSAAAPSRRAPRACARPRAPAAHPRRARDADRLRDVRQGMVGAAGRCLRSRACASAASRPPMPRPGNALACGKIYCVGCASAHLRDRRFYCPDCEEPLKLSDDSLKWLLARAIDGFTARSGAAG